MKPLIVINRLVIKPGSIEEFIDAQREYSAALPPCGLIGGRMYRSLDSQTATLVSVFQSKSALDEVYQRADFKAHIERMRSFIESSTPMLYEEAYTTGDFR